jgi:transcriptional regulator with XRE-family HTH domain
MNFIQEARLSKGITQKELETMTGLSITAISRYEAGHTPPSFTAIVALSKALDIPLNKFAEWCENITTSKDISIIREARLSKGITQDELAEITGYTQNTISAYETGRAFPSMNAIMILSKALDIPLEKFVEWYQSRKNNTTTEAV